MISLQVAAEAMSLTEACLKSLSSWAQLLLDSYSWRTFWALADRPGQPDNRSTFSANFTPDSPFSKRPQGRASNIVTMCSAFLGCNLGWYFANTDGQI